MYAPYADTDNSVQYALDTFKSASYDIYLVYEDILVTAIIYFLHMMVRPRREKEAQKQEIMFIESQDSIS